VFEKNSLQCRPLGEAVLNAGIDEYWVVSGQVESKKPAKN